MDYRMENGRTYHGYKEGKYNLPNDETENERLELQHNLFLLTFDKKLGNAPPNDRDAKVGRVLDIGTGTGLWAVDFGDEHPEAEVLGVDLSATFNNYSPPPNVMFEVDDIEEPWTYSPKFDYIHSRMMNGCINDWEDYAAKCFEYVSVYVFFFRQIQSLSFVILHPCIPGQTFRLIGSRSVGLEVQFDLAAAQGPPIDRIVEYRGLPNLRLESPFYTYAAD
ncbi:methyltransferase domain-containing protein [Colletotrichum kahawae]|uniref:Methyltransferase domain-containing protein n=1 Tax=Colletotrichum kahawae TaxID=34407 RepID=A0AAD9YI10_COLKA|nr:methyltransferase domain-containing protein [Colletotrichum kahawae]